MSRRLYCLRCFGDLSRELATCPGCGYRHRLREHQTYWNRSRGAVFVERVLKLGVVVAVVLLFDVSMHSASGVGSGWFIATPLIVGLGLWQTVSKITRTQ